MIFKKLFIGFVIILVISACQNNPLNTDNTAAADKEDFDKFVQHFQKFDLPNYLPAESDTGKELNKASFLQFYKDKTLKGAFSDPYDVPDPANNSESASFFPIGQFRIGNTIALIVKKVDNGKYFYISTHDTLGTFIDGVCVAFEEGDSLNNSTRTAAFNDDLSIQLRQVETVDGKKQGEDLTSIFIINPDGTLTNVSGKENQVSGRIN